jgi:hypothetical protein
MNVLRIGRNMVKSLQFWAEATGVLKAAEGGGHEPGPAGVKLFGGKGAWDPYLGSLESLWLIHWQLCTGCLGPRRPGRCGEAEDGAGVDGTGQRAEAAPGKQAGKEANPGSAAAQAGLRQCYAAGSGYLVDSVPRMTVLWLDSAPPLPWTSATLQSAT